MLLTSELQLETLAQHLNLKFEVQLEFGRLIEFDEQLQNSHEPRIRRLEDDALVALLEDFSNKRNHNDETVRVITLQKQFLYAK